MHLFFSLNLLLLFLSYVACFMVIPYWLHWIIYPKWIVRNRNVYMGIMSYDDLDMKIAEIILEQQPWR